jgi:Xaa-Pro aminopeptidase
MNAERIKGRLGPIRSELRRKRIDGVILVRDVNVTYVTGFSGEDSWVLLTPRAAYLLTDSRYTEQARKECPHATIVERKGPMAEAVEALLKKLRSVQAIGIEKSISLASYEALRKRVKARLKPVEGLVERPRSVKDAREIETIRTSAGIAAVALRKAKRAFRPGITESELAGIIDLEIRKQGATTSFETIVAFGPNASRPHHQPTQKKLKSQDTILIDFGAQYNGYCSDITRCFSLGKPTRAYRQAYETVEKAQAAAIAAARARAALVDVDAAARDVIRTAGLPVYGHGTGHGIGLEIHEDPFLKEQAKDTLQAGQVITIEPGVYIPGKLGVRIEDDILITDDGCEILTDMCPHTPLPA